MSLGPSLFCLGLGPSAGLSECDSSAVLKSLELLAASWMICGCSHTKVNLVGLLGGGVGLGIRFGALEGAFLCLGSSSADEMWPSLSEFSLRFE